jgi:hypothetical protein
MKLGELGQEAPLKILVYGDSGSGKTCFAAGFPAPIEFADFDGKASSAANYFRNNAEQLGSIEVESYLLNHSVANDLPFVRFYNRLLAWEKAIREKTFVTKTVVVDSLTLLVERLMEDIIRQHGATKRVDTKTPALQDYLVLSKHFDSILYRLLSLPCHVVMTAHIGIEKDELTGEIVRQPLLPGKMARALPIKFSEVYRTFVEQSTGEEPKHYAQTRSDGRYNCRTQIPGIPPRIRLDYKELTEHLSRAYGPKGK